MGPHGARNQHVRTLLGSYGWAEERRHRRSRAPRRAEPDDRGSSRPRGCETKRGYRSGPVCRAPFGPFPSEPHRARARYIYIYIDIILYYIYMYIYIYTSVFISTYNLSPNIVFP